MFFSKFIFSWLLFFSWLFFFCRFLLANFIPVLLNEINDVLLGPISFILHQLSSSWPKENCGESFDVVSITWDIICSCVLQVPQKISENRSLNIKENWYAREPVDVWRVWLEVIFFEQTSRKIKWKKKQNSEQLIIVMTHTYL